MLKRNLVLAGFMATLAITGCSKQTHDAAANGQPEAAASSAGQDMRNTTASAADATASATRTGAAVATGAAINGTEAISNGANRATARVASSVATGATNVAQDATAVANDAANRHTDIQTTTDIPEKQKY